MSSLPCIYEYVRINIQGSFGDLFTLYTQSLDGERRSRRSEAPRRNDRKCSIWFTIFYRYLEKTSLMSLDLGFNEYIACGVHPLLSKFLSSPIFFLFTPPKLEERCVTKPLLESCTSSHVYTLQVVRASEKACGDQR
jgi:hypothetical protein